MCVMAGYLGKQRAAPILLEMLRREEGLAGGFYTGIVTVHEGRLYHEKVVGDLEALLTQTRALELPGVVGLAHSRTPGGGGRAWAHPFIDSLGKLAYIANGAEGPYQGKVDFDEAARALVRQGYTFPSASEKKVGRYPMLSDGRCVHYSDILCQEISARYEGLHPAPNRLLAAACSAYERLPGSIAGLCLHADRPHEIVGVRHNKPIEIGRLEDGSWVLASASLAFPEGVSWQMRMPALCGAKFGWNGTIQLASFTRAGLIPVSPAPSASAVSGALVAQLRQKGEMSAPEFRDAVVPLSQPGCLNEKEVIAFGLLATLQAEGRVALVDRRVPGVEPGTTAPMTYIRWRE